MVLTLMAQFRAWIFEFGEEILERELWTTMGLSIAHQPSTVHTRMQPRPDEFVGILWRIGSRTIGTILPAAVWSMIWCVQSVVSVQETRRLNCAESVWRVLTKLQ